MTFVFACVLAVVIAWGAMKLVIAGRHFRRALVWAPLWGVLLGFWAAAPRILTSHDVAGSGAIGWIGAYALLVLGFAALGLACAIPAGGLLAALHRVPPFRSRDPEWLFALGMVVALPMGCVLLDVILAAATGRPPVVLDLVALGGKHQLRMELAVVGMTLVVYRRATRRGWTTVVLAVPLVLFSLAGAAALPLRLEHVPSGDEHLSPVSTEPQFAVAGSSSLQRT